MVLSTSATFNQNIKGKYNKEAAFVAIQSGSDAYLLEDEVNELQWLQIEQRNQASALLYKPGVISPTVSNPFTVEAQNNININQLNVFYYGLNIQIPQQVFKITTSNASRTECLFIEVWFQLIPASATSVKTYGNQNTSQRTAVEITDRRIHTATSQRVQVQTKYKFVTITDTIVGKTGTFSTIQEVNTDYGYSLYIEQTNNANVINGICAVFPIANIKRSTSSIKQTDVTNIIVNPISLVDNNSEAIDNLQALYDALLDRVNNISTEVLDDQKAYGLSMNKKVALYTGYGDDMYTGTEITIDNYSVADNNFCYALTNLGNHYVGQIGELWTYVNNDKYYVCNSGCKNAVFNAFDFRLDNNELAYLDIQTAGNNQAVTVDAESFYNGVALDLSNKKISDCIVCAIPRYTTAPNSVPSIGDIYWSTSSDINSYWNTISIYNTGAANIPLRVFIIYINHDNLSLTYENLNNSTIVNDRYGRHHQLIKQDVTYGHTQVLVGTPFMQNAPADINVGEIYVEQNDKMFVLNTTSYGEAKLPILVFKTAYTNGGE